MAVDVMEAVRAALLEDGAIAELTTKIFGALLPDDEIEGMPEKLIVIRASGGIEDNSYIDIVRPRFDIYSYGETFYEAGKLDRAVYDVMKTMRRKKISGILMHSVACGGGPLQVQHAETGWPIIWRSYQVTASDIDVT